MMQEFDDSGLYEPIAASKWLDVRKMDSTQHQWFMVAVSYKKAADLLVDGLSESLLLGAERIYIACPIMFLYRHFLETGLKGLMLDLQALGKLNPWNSTIDPQVLDAELPDHQLMESWQLVKKLLIGLNEEGGNDSAELEEGHAIYSAIEDRINEFSQIDARSYNFRYPVDRRNSKPILAKLPDAQQLQRVKEVATIIEDYVGGFGAWAHDQREGIIEAQYYY